VLFDSLLVSRAPWCRKVGDASNCGLELRRSRGPERVSRREFGCILPVVGNVHAQAIDGASHSRRDGTRRSRFAATRHEIPESSPSRPETCTTSASRIADAQWGEVRVLDRAEDARAVVSPSCRRSHARAERDRVERALGRRANSFAWVVGFMPRG